MDTPNDKKTLVHKTPQEIIHIKHNISVRQYKYWILLLKAYKELWEAGIQKDEKGFYTIAINGIADLMGYELVKKELKADLEALRQQPIIINYLEKNKKPVTHGMGFISEWKVTSNQIAFKIPSFLEDVIRGDLEAKEMFLLLNWDIFNSFNGKYEAIIYKLCKDYIGIGKTPYFELQAYRDYIGLKDDEYKQFFELNRWTISKPIKNINDNLLSDIVIDVEFKKSGRKVLGLNFIMKYKSQNQQITQIESNEPNLAFANSLITFTITKQREYLEKYNFEQIGAIIDYVNKQHKQGKIKNLSAYYAKAFENGWGLENFEAELKKQEQEKEIHQQIQSRIKVKIQEKKQAEEKEKQARKEREECVKIFESLPKDEQEKILDIIFEQTPPFMASYFQKDRELGLKPYQKPPHIFHLVHILKNKHLFF